MGLIKAFVEAVKTGKQEVLGTDVEEVLKSHLTVFAAETSRRLGKVVDCGEFEKDARKALEVDNKVDDSSLRGVKDVESKNGIHI